MAVSLSQRIAPEQMSWWSPSNDGQTSNPVPKRQQLLNVLAVSAGHREHPEVGHMHKPPPPLRESSGILVVHSSSQHDEDGPWMHASHSLDKLLFFFKG